jgi:sigma-E factor negative regulatory protein RseA
MYGSDCAMTGDTMNDDVTMQAQEQLSALADGELRGGEFARAMDFAGTPAGQQAWHAYHLIGDVLRGASQPQTHVAHDVLLARLRTQLAREQVRPALVAGQPAAAVRIHRPAANAEQFRWKLAAGVASLAAVVAVGWNTLATHEAAAPQGAQLALVQPMPAPAALAAPAAPLLASAPLAGQPAAAVAVSDLSPAMSTVGVGSSVAPGAGPLGQGAPVMIRDPRLDELLAAHRRFGHTAALQMPAGFLRNASFEAPGKQKSN